MKYAITDTLDNQDFDLICSGTDNLKFLTGGSGIALGLPKVFKKKGMLKKATLSYLMLKETQSFFQALVLWQLMNK